jgi:zinc protease
MPAGRLLRVLRAGLLAALVGGLALPGPATALTRSAPAGSTSTALPAWPQAASDIPPDPGFRFGVLANGMRYAVRRQTLPPGQAALRLHIAAGSLNEAEGQQGLAHFVEHMAFNGSTRVPEGEMVRILERLGLAFGADTNASTGFEETIYRLDLPNTDRETLETSLMLLREVAGELSFAPAAVDRERGVVMSEERSGDSPALRAARAISAFQFRDQLPPRRFPIDVCGTPVRSANSKSVSPPSAWAWARSANARFVPAFTEARSAAVRDVSGSSQRTAGASVTGSNMDAASITSP